MDIAIARRAHVATATSYNCQYGFVSAVLMAALCLPSRVIMRYRRLAEHLAAIALIVHVGGGDRRALALQHTHAAAILSDETRRVLDIAVPLPAAAYAVALDDALAEKTKRPPLIGLTYRAVTLLNPSALPFWHEEALTQRAATVKCAVRSTIH